MKNGKSIKIKMPMLATFLLLSTSVFAIACAERKATAKFEASERWGNDINIGITEKNAGRRSLPEIDPQGRGLSFLTMEERSERMGARPLDERRMGSEQPRAGPHSDARRGAVWASFGGVVSGSCCVQSGQLESKHAVPVASDHLPVFAEVELVPGAGAE